MNEITGERVTSRCAFFLCKVTRTLARFLVEHKAAELPESVRRIALAWRKSFPRVRAVRVVREALLACRLPA